MAKQDTADLIKAANGTDLDVENYSQKELDALLDLANGGDATRAEFDQMVVSAKGSPRTSTQKATAPSAASTPKVKTVTVRVSDAIAAYGGEFVDPESRKAIGKTPVEVPHTAFVKAKIRSDELVEE